MMIKDETIERFLRNEMNTKEVIRFIQTMQSKRPRERAEALCVLIRGLKNRNL